MEDDHNYLFYGEHEVLDIISKIINILTLEPQLVTINNSSIVVGDIHGDYSSLNKVLALSHEKCSDCVVIFLGDYVDRGTEQLEVLLKLMELKLQEPERFILLRGNHETLTISASYGFLDVIKERYPGRWPEIFMAFNKMFSGLPYAALVNDYLLLHGGIPKEVNDLEQIYKIRKGLMDPTPYNNSIAYQILWNDPADYVIGFIPGVRGDGSYIFGYDVTKDFLNKNKLKGIVRSHEPVASGYTYLHDGLILNIFTCSYYGYPISIALIIDDHLIPIIVD
jgi:protein phosphatase